MATIAMHKGIEREVQDGGGLLWESGGLLSVEKSRSLMLSNPHQAKYLTDIKLRNLKKLKNE